MTDQPHCRIRRVRMKDGADVTVLHRQPVLSRHGADLLADSRTVATLMGPDLTGYFVIPRELRDQMKEGRRRSLTLFSDNQ